MRSADPKIGTIASCATLLFFPATGQNIPTKPDGMRRLVIDLGGRQWHIHLTPGTLEVVAFSIIMMVLAIALLFAWIARRRAKQAEAAVKALKKEMLERSRAEESIRYITARKEAEEQLRVIQEAHSAQLAKKNRELGLRNQEIERANRLKSEFLAGMSHELRTPLHTIIGFTELLAEELEGPLNDKQKRFINHVHRDALHLLDLINALLDLSKIEAGKLELKPAIFDLHTVIEEALGSLKVRSDIKGIHIDQQVAIGTEVYADRLRVKQILLNLLSNAVKFAPEHGHVLISATPADKFVEISIRDNGPGIPRESQSAIFDKFYQIAGSVSAQHEGTGLGLAITKSLVEQHGGRIWLESEPGNGSCFSFSLPFKREPE